MKSKYPRWVKTLLATPMKARWGWVEDIIDGLKEYRKKKLNKNEKYLSEAIEEGIKSGEYDVVGLGYETNYIKVTGPANKGDCIWTHPYMNPGLILKHKHLPYIIIVGPALRKDSSILNESGIRGDEVEGLTGP